MLFEVLLNNQVRNIAPYFELRLIENDHLLSIINDFEDGKWRYKKFQNYIWDNIAETTLNYKEREALVNQSLLTAAAKNLRLSDKDDATGEGSELAEILLYALMKDHYKALPVVPKIFYKQNTQDYAKGSDSVHIVIEDNEEFSLWFGEAKFYNSVDNSRLSRIVESVKNSLRTDKLKKECSIISGVSDISYIIGDNIAEKVKAVLSYQNSIDTIKELIHVPILLLYECSITKTESVLTEEYRRNIKELHVDIAKRYFSKQLENISDIFLHEKIKFHFILFPVPDKENIVSKFIENVEFYRGD
ncbi:HamA C-terminal domain-containing protein [Spirochaeta lutea]|uniref:Anti-bacteriophage protein A/HamA C-terminal domain-containing protein n=1 Tax=Spirochaeta lutea TaxID=1480694 RepID=A0A098R0Y6_9SPIO|nr:DUF1837 domain-containing protein [Spirochaeta lutea]KGE73664.1 hypothetical protein DC28_01575 [Spirochaeta lutea]